MTHLLSTTEIERLARLPLRALRREYPNHISHLLNGPQDAGTPREQHPAFYGSFDWHSAVHGFWLLARSARLRPDAHFVLEIVQLFDEHLTDANLGQECAYFEAAGRAAYERPYGWAWLLALGQEVAAWQHERSAAWCQALEPLVRLLRERAIGYFSIMSYPVRAGTHGNTAFAMVLMLDFARSREDEAFEQAIRAAALRYYASDRDYPSSYEPGGDDFLSGGLVEAVLMGALLARPAFVDWFAGFLPVLGSLATPAEVSDRADPKIAHLDGLNLSRAWCLRRLARVLPAGATHAALADAAGAHVAASLPAVTSGHYEGEHWLATFAMLALDEPDGGGIAVAAA